jgi:hypothetical protein
LFCCINKKKEVCKKRKMSYQNEQYDYLQESSYKPVNQLPQGLNVLTILSFIGNGMQILGSIFTFFIIGYSVKLIQNQPLAEDNPFAKIFGGFQKMSNEATLKQYEYRYLMLIVSLTGAALCIYGAFQMRKRKKIGFTVYTIGEFLLPLVTLAVIGIFSAAFGLAIAVIFFILFAVQRKHLTE